ncbi:hypothetical protein SAMN06295920_10462 [Rhizorhabdus histidinilytica]|uniref:Uncharacterized protein n=1 Tax=Rhizorhabdus histidinilytica TaxID=439228 RepID=A0A1T5CH30_9SPHN|nr:hypothetical protein SAMN06295920_10462 [Rhizorhabdus histidinilytica]
MSASIESCERQFNLFPGNVDVTVGCIKCLTDISTLLVADDAQDWAACKRLDQICCGNREAPQMHPQVKPKGDRSIGGLHCRRGDGAQYVALRFEAYLKIFHVVIAGAGKVEHIGHLVDQGGCEPDDFRSGPNLLAVGCGCSPVFHEESPPYCGGCSDHCAEETEDVVGFSAKMLEQNCCPYGAARSSGGEHDLDLLIGWLQSHRCAPAASRGAYVE